MPSGARPGDKRSGKRNNTTVTVYVFGQFSPDSIYHDFCLFRRSEPALAGVSFGSVEEVRPNGANHTQLTNRKAIIAWSLS